MWITLHHATALTLDSMSVQIYVCKISKGDASLLSASRIIVLRRHNPLLFTMFSCNTRFIDLFQCTSSYSVTFEVEYHVQFL